MPRKRKPVLLALFCLIGTGLSGYLGCGQPDGQTDRKSTSPVGAKDQTPEPIPVVLTLARSRTFKGNLSVQATLKAKNVAMVSARVPGIIEAIYVEEGDLVTAHETRLFKINSQDFEKNLEIRRQDFTFSVKERRDKETALELMKADLQEAKIELCRYRKLLADGIVCSKELGQSESKYKRSAASYKCAKSAFRLACARKRLAQVSLEIAENEFRDTLVCAPISGRICRRFQKPDEISHPGTPVLRIEDPTLIEVVAYLPERYYALVQPGKTVLVVKTINATFSEQVVSYKSFSINPKLRAFKIKSLLKDPPEDVMSGDMAEIVISLPLFEGIGVPSSAVQRRGQKEVVFVFQGEKVHMVPVQTGIKSDGWTQVMSHELAENTLVVSQSQSWLEEGTPIVVRMEGE